MSALSKQSQLAITLNLSLAEADVVFEALKYAKLSKERGSAPKTLMEQNVALIERIQENLSLATKAAEG